MRGPEARKQRLLEAQKQRITIRLDKEIVGEFKTLSDGRGYQSLINQALKEWLLARNIKELVRSELGSVVEKMRQAVSELEDLRKSA